METAMVYTLGEAAIAVGKSKATISKAIKSGRISADKQPNGSYKIDPSELHRVYPPALSTVEGERKETPSSTEQKIRETIELEVKLQAADKRISELEEDREHWRQQATRLLAHTDKERQGFWKRLFS
jgi:predicted  nucleic acid-binding Zn-ribbon protein